MSNMTSVVKNMREKEINKAVPNFMGGISYELNPLDTMKMVTASSIFGEPQYYRDGQFAEKTCHKDTAFCVDPCMTEYIIKELDTYKGKSTSEVMETVIDQALQFDFKATLEYAIELRETYLMRLNPQIIMVRAAIMTEKRVEFTRQYPGLFDEINQRVMSRADDVMSQLTYYLFLNNGKKNQIPGILKNSWKKRMERLTRYELNKYGNTGIGMINTVRICHAHTADIEELMETGHVVVPEKDNTWEHLRASGKSWSEILDIIHMNHMALLRNLRGICKEVEDSQLIDELLKTLEQGVKKGKQFPYRYLSAYYAIKEAKSTKNTVSILDSLENCMDIACENLPKLKGNNAFLSDNSGSAWYTCPSEYGTMTIAEIGNLSSVIGAANSDRGTVFAFGDKLVEHQISKRNGILKQAAAISERQGEDVGKATENGIWIFFQDAINNKIHYDNIFIYSDQQAGHGGLYGLTTEFPKYKSQGFAVKHTRYIDVAKLVHTYRTKVNPKVNVYSIQTAGYDNVLIPENGYRTNILYGWTGKELVYADILNRFWDEQDNRKLVNQ